LRQLKPLSPFKRRKDSQSGGIGRRKNVSILTSAVGLNQNNECPIFKASGIPSKKWFAVTFPYRNKFASWAGDLWDVFEHTKPIASQTPFAF
jgi:hypothetical protein